MTRSHRHWRQSALQKYTAPIVTLRRSSVTTNVSLGRSVSQNHTHPAGLSRQKCHQRRTPELATSTTLLKRPVSRTNLRSSHHDRVAFSSCSQKCSTRDPIPHLTQARCSPSSTKCTTLSRHQECPHKPSSCEEWTPAVASYFQQSNHSRSRFRSQRSPVALRTSSCSWSSRGAGLDSPGQELYCTGSTTVGQGCAGSSQPRMVSTSSSTRPERFQVSSADTQPSVRSGRRLGDSRRTQSDARFCTWRCTKSMQRIAKAHGRSASSARDCLVSFSSARSDDLGVRLHHGALTSLRAPSPQTAWCASSWSSPLRRGHPSA